MRPKPRFDDQAARSPLIPFRSERLDVVHARGGRGERVPLVEAGRGVHHEPRVRHRPRHGADVGEAPRRAEGIDGDQAEGRLDPKMPAHDAGIRMEPPEQERRREVKPMGCSTAVSREPLCSLSAVAMREPL